MMNCSMVQNDRDEGMYGPVVGEGGRTPSTPTTGQDTPALKGGAALGPLAPGQRWGAFGGQPALSDEATAVAICSQSSFDARTMAADFGRVAEVRGGVWQRRTDHSASRRRAESVSIHSETASRPRSFSRN